MKPSGSDPETQTPNNLRRSSGLGQFDDAVGAFREGCLDPGWIWRMDLARPLSGKLDEADQAREAVASRTR